MEADFHAEVAEQRSGANPWERVVSNCEMKSNEYVGGQDVSRMRQSMIARKTDITKGASKKML